MPTASAPEMVEVAFVLVALKFPNVGVEVATTCPEALVERSELTETPESVIGPEVNAEALSVPKVAFVAKRLVEEAIDEKKLVVVAAVPVALVNVKF